MNKSDITEISSDITYMWNLKKKKLTYKTDTHRLREQTYGCWGKEEGKG